MIENFKSNHTMVIQNINSNSLICNFVFEIKLTFTKTFNLPVAVQICNKIAYTLNN